MHFFVGPARAGLIVVACLLAACSGAADREHDGDRAPGTPTSGSPAASTSPATPSDPPAQSGSTSSGSTSSGSTSSGSTPGVAVCEPDAACHGITSCVNYCYGPDCCTARCDCTDARDSSARLLCSLLCNPSH